MPTSTPDRTGRTLLFLYKVGGIPLAEAWRIVRPDSVSTGHNATAQASRLIKRYRERWPLNFQEAALVHGLTPDFIRGTIMELLKANKWKRNKKQEKWVETDKPDRPARIHGMARYQDMTEIGFIQRN